MIIIGNSIITLNRKHFSSFSFSPWYKYIWSTGYKSLCSSHKPAGYFSSVPSLRFQDLLFITSSWKRAIRLPFTLRIKPPAFQPLVRMENSEMRFHLRAGKASRYHGDENIHEPVQNICFGFKRTRCDITERPRPLKSSAATRCVPRGSRPIISHADLLLGQTPVLFYYPAFIIFNFLAVSDCWAFGYKKQITWIRRALPSGTRWLAAQTAVFCPLLTTEQAFLATSKECIARSRRYSIASFSD